MSKLRNFLGFLLAAGLVLGLAGCPDPNKGGGGDDAFFKEKGNGKLLTDNLGTQDLVLFYDTVRASNSLGGLPANADNFRIKLPDSNRLYVIYAVKYSDYKGKPSNEIQNIKVLDSTLVYSDPINDTTCRIGDPKSGGTAEIRFTNQTNFFIEVGKNSAGNEDLFYVMKPNSIDSVFVQPESAGYTMYMTLNLPMKKNGKITGVQRRFIDAWTDIIVPQTGKVETVTISNAEVTDLAPNYREGYLRIVNNGGRGYRVLNGSQAIASTIGFSAISNGSEQVWELLGDNNEPGRTYAQFKFEAGSAQYNLDAPSFSIRNGYKYTMEIHPDGTSPKITISTGTPLDPDEEEIIW
jgi:hypothetical protein